MLPGGGFLGPGSRRGRGQGPLASVFGSQASQPCWGAPGASFLHPTYPTVTWRLLLRFLLPGSGVPTFPALCSPPLGPFHGQAQWSALTVGSAGSSGSVCYGVRVLGLSHRLVTGGIASAVAASPPEETVLLKGWEHNPLPHRDRPATRPPNHFSFSLPTLTAPPDQEHNSSHQQENGDNNGDGGHPLVRG